MAQISLALDALQRVYENCRSSGGLPTRLDLTVETLKPWLGSLCILTLERSPDRIKLRLHGTKVVAVDGKDWTGRYLDDSLPADSRDEVMAPLWTAANERMPLRDRIAHPLRAGLAIDRLILPVSRDGDGEIQLITCQYFDAGASGAKMPPNLDLFAPVPMPERPPWMAQLSLAETDKPL